jgi:redox-sensing transcriptional repressor
VGAGVTSILNLSATHLQVPDHVIVRPVDLATEIQILAVHAAGREGS